MFSDELEMLIDAAIADGEISEKERAILHKRAQAEGVDTDELDMIIDARIAKLSKENTSPKTQVIENDSQKGRALEELKSSLESMRKERDEKIMRLQLNSQKQQKISDSQKTQLRCMISDIESDSTKSMVDFVESFVIPSTRQDIIDFMIFFQPHLKKNIFNTGGASSEEYKLAKAYIKKRKELQKVIEEKFSNDPDLSKYLEPKEEKKGFFGSLFGKK